MIRNKKKGILICISCLRNFQQIIILSDRIFILMQINMPENNDLKLYYLNKSRRHDLRNLPRQALTLQSFISSILINSLRHIFLFLLPIIAIQFHPPNYNERFVAFPFVCFNCFWGRNSLFNGCMIFLTDPSPKNGIADSKNKEKCTTKISEL